MGCSENLEAAEESQWKVHLVTGGRNAGKSAYSLCMIVEEVLQLNPFCGDIYAFCNCGRQIIDYVYWDGKGLRKVSRRKESGTYIWPGARLGATVCVSRGEFEYLMGGNGENTREKMPQILEKH